MRSLALVQASDIARDDYGVILAAVGIGESQVVAYSTRTSILIVKADNERLAEVPYTDEEPTVVLLQWLATAERLSLVLSDGRLFSISPLDDDDNNECESIGRLDTAICAAAWSPDEELLIVIASRQLVVLDAGYETLCTRNLSADRHGSERAEALGWGAEATQFRGSRAQQEAAAPVASSSTASDTANADSRTTLAWRGDGQYFCVNSLKDESDDRCRLLRFYTRAGQLTSTTEVGNTAALAWQPSGSLIASVVQDQIVFYERNGLQRSVLPLSPWRTNIPMIRALAWNHASTLLAVTLVHPDCNDHVVRIYTRQNYHWYLKHETMPLDGLLQAYWHPERHDTLWLICQERVLRRSFVWNTVRAGPSIAVLDGSVILVTDLSRSLVPPPMSSFTLHAPQETVSYIDAGFSDTGSSLAALQSSGAIDIWTTVAQGTPVLTWATPASNCQFTRIAIARDGGDYSVAVVASSSHCNSLHLRSSASPSWELLALPYACVCISSEQRGFILHLDDGSFRLVDMSSRRLVEMFTLSRPCSAVDVLPSSSGPVVIALSFDGCLFVNERVVLQKCTSFALCGPIIAATTSDAKLHMIPSPESSPSQVMPTPRQLERGALLLAAAVSAVYLYMPRGNIETIAPRFLVVEQIGALTARGEFGKAFFFARKHRVRLDILLIRGNAPFLTSLESFIDEVVDPDYLSVFLQSLQDSAYEHINEVAKAFIDALALRDHRRYRSTVLTAHLCMQPNSVEGALMSICEADGQHDAEATEEALRFLFMLVPDTERLYNAALGMYNLRLALLIAQQAGKDPREFVPFLQRLRTASPSQRCFQIDNHLGRHAAALRHLAETDGTGMDEVVAFAMKHNLTTDLVRLYARQPLQRQRAVETHADYLFRQGRYHEAAAAFGLVDQHEKLLSSLKAALAWQEYFALLLSPRHRPAPGQREVASLSAAMADMLSSNQRYSEAATVRLAYAHDVEGALAEHARAGQWSEGCRLVRTIILLLGSRCVGSAKHAQQAYLYGKSDLVATVLIPAAFRAASALRESISEARAQGERQTIRLLELIAIRAHANNEASEPVVDDQIEVASDDSTAAGSLFTRYTVQRSTASGMSSSTAATARGRRRQALKELAGKRGGPGEEAYIYASLGKLATSRLEVFRVDAQCLIDGLLLLRQHAPNSDPSPLSEAAAMQHELLSFETKLDALLDEGWAEADANDAQCAVRPSRPTITPSMWRSELLDLL